MNLLLPAGLAALAALPIIVFLHMRHTTPRIKPVPTLRFWLAAKPERTEQTHLRRPPISLLLLLQLAIAGLIGFALARPVTSQALDRLGINLRTEPRHLIVLLDGSTSMAAIDTPTGTSRFEVARAIAADRLADLREGDVATLFVLGTRSTSLGATDAGSFTTLRQRLATIAQPGGRTNLDAALALSRDLLLPELDDVVVVITDGALAADPTTVSTLGAPIELVQVGTGAATLAPANVAVVDISSRANPSTPELLEIYARVVNFGPEPVTVTATLFGDTIEQGRQTETLDANGGDAELTWPLPPETANAMVSVDVADALAADNVAALILRQGEEEDLALKILLISDAPSELQRALIALTGARVTTEPSDNLPSALAAANYDLIVFERALPPPELVSKLQAPLLIVNPPAGGLFATDGTMLTPRVTRLLARDPLLHEVDLGGVTFGETPNFPLDPSRVEVVGADQGPLIFRASVGAQPALVFAFDVAQSNLPLRVSFPILIANAVADLAPSPLPPAVPLGDPLVYRPRVSAATIRVTPPDGDPVRLTLAVDDEAESPPVSDSTQGSPGERLREVTFADTGQPGVYAVAEIGEADQTLSTGAFVVNAGHPIESNLRANPELPAILANARATAAAGPGRAHLTDGWPLLAAIALVFLALEWLVALFPRRSGKIAAPGGPPLASAAGGARRSASASSG